VGDRILHCTKLTIGLNLVHAHPHIGGAWQYISRLIDVIYKLPENFQFIAYTNKASDALIRKGGRIQAVQTGLTGKNRYMRIGWEHCVLPWLARRDRIDVMHWFANTVAVTNSVTCVNTVYDLLVFEKPSAYPVARRFYVRNLFPLTLRATSCIAAMSETTAGALSSRFGPSLPPVTVVPPALPSRFRVLAPEIGDRFRDKHRLPQDFFLYVSHWRPHKNHRALLHAYARARRENPRLWPLVLCGRPLKMHAEIFALICELRLKENIIHLSDLDEEDMPLLFNAASTLVFPSLYEGGGIPLVEAIACGCPVIASDIPTSREFGGEAVDFFRPTDHGDIARALLEAQSRSVCRQVFRADAERHVAKYRESEVARRLETVYSIAVEGCMQGNF
jgi:glycosyltransferase involved in cell wall biosynthesis